MMSLTYKSGFYQMVHDVNRAELISNVRQATECCTRNDYIVIQPTLRRNISDVLTFTDMCKMCKTYLHPPNNDNTRNKL